MYLRLRSRACMRVRYIMTVHVVIYLGPALARIMYVYYMYINNIVWLVYETSGGITGVQVHVNSGEKTNTYGKIENEPHNISTVQRSRLFLHEIRFEEETKYRSRDE